MCQVRGAVLHCVRVCKPVCVLVIWFGSVCHRDQRLFIRLLVWQMRSDQVAHVCLSSPSPRRSYSAVESVSPSKSVSNSSLGLGPEPKLVTLSFLILKDVPAGFGGGGFSLYFRSSCEMSNDNNGRRSRKQIGSSVSFENMNYRPTNIPVYVIKYYQR